MFKLADTHRNFPQGAQAELLQVIVSPKGQVAEGWTRWQEKYSLKDVEIYRLIPALYFRLQEEGVEGGTYLRGVVRHSYAAGAIQKQAAEDMARRLAEKGIPAMALKGLAIALHLGYAPRHMSDIDLLIPYDRINDAVDVVLAAGWIPNYGVTAEDVKLSPTVAHGWGFQRGPVQFDLHWHSVHQDQNPTFDAPIWETAIRKGPLLVPTKSYLLFQVLLHGIRQFSRALVWPADLFSLLKAPGGIDWDALTQLATDRRLLAPLHVLRETLRGHVDVPGELDLKQITPVEAEEHRGLTTQSPSFTEYQSVCTMSSIRRNAGGRLPHTYRHSLYFRMGRRPPTV